jgi:hypothetical protein
MPQTDFLIFCANCARPVREADAEALGWRCWSDGVGKRHLICSLCAHRESSPDAPASADH